MQASIFESRTIEHVPETERYGKPWHLFTLWWSINLQITPVATGALAVVLGLNLPWAIFAIVIGNALGGLFMAYHSAQGPKLGLPQMIQSRAQFGVLGAILPLLSVIVLGYGYFAVSAVLGGQAAATLLHVPIWSGIIIVNFLTIVLAIAGYELIQRYERIVAGILGIIFLVITIRLFTAPHVQSAKYAVTGGTVLLAISIFVTWQITYAPYVSDYSRYLPARTRTATTFWYTYLGTVLSSTWMMCLGAGAAILAENAVSDDTAHYLGGVFGSSASAIFYLAVIAGIVATNVANLYTPFLTFLSAIEPAVKLRGIATSGRVWRVAVCIVGGVIGTVLAIAGNGTGFFTDFTNFLLLLLYVMIPWTAINLVDFYIVKRGKYSVTDIFNSAGIYHRFNWKTIAVFLGTIAIEVPFMNSTLYSGPFAKYMGGADISWIVGLAVASGAYLLVGERPSPEQVDGMTQPAGATLVESED